jgi:hypothetical protein
VINPDPDDALNRQLVALTDTLVSPVTAREVIERVQSGAPRVRRLSVVPGSLIVLVSCVLLVLALAGGLFVARENGVSRPTGGPKAAIDQLAVNFAAAAGDPKPRSVTWVATNRRAAEVALAGSLASFAKSQPQVPVYALQVKGNFDIGIGEPGTVLQLIATRSAFEVNYDVVQVSVRSMANLGATETDTLNGIRPESDAEFRARFHLRSSRLQEAIDQMAADEGTGGPAPTSVTWVATLQSAAEYVLTQTAGSGGTPVYALQIEGHFVLDVPHPEGSRLPSGRVRIDIFTQDGWSDVSEGVGGILESEQSLGTPETDPLLGIKPLTPAQFHAKFPKLPPPVTPAITSPSLTISPVKGGPGTLVHLRGSSCLRVPAARNQVSFFFRDSSANMQSVRAFSVTGGRVSASFRIGKLEPPGDGTFVLSCGSGQTFVNFRVT